MRQVFLVVVIAIAFSFIRFRESTAMLSPSLEEPKTKADSTSFAVKFQEFRLNNGLRVILSEDHSAPTYSLCVTYDVGSRDEREGRTGFAHLFEHMMFQGSENVGKGEHFILVENNGGYANGQTTFDCTCYFEDLPINKIDLGLFLEADRMRSLDITQENLDNQRNVVREERRLKIDNTPYGRTSEAILGTAYDSFAYKHSVFGSMQDISEATIKDAEEFFKAYYAPNNAVLALVGDFNTNETLQKIKHYFESIPSSAKPSEPVIIEAEQKQERRKVIKDEFASDPRIDIVFKIPKGNTPDWYALRKTGYILVNGRSSRLYKKLVAEKELAISVTGQVEEHRGPSLFSITIMPKPGKGPSDIEEIVYSEVERLKNEFVEDWEVQKVQRQMRLDRARQLQATMRRAIPLSKFTALYDDPDLINTIESKYEAVKREDVRRVAAVYLRASNRTVIITLPGSSEYK